MLQEFSEGKRIHGVIGELIYNKPWGDLDEQQMLRAKGVVFGSFYGRSARSIAIEHQVPIKTAEYWQSVCIMRYPGIRSYLKKQADEFYKTQRCTTPFGRVRFLQIVTQSYNTPVQSSASDVMLTGLIELYKAGFDLRISVHDSVILHVKDCDIPDATRELKRILERPIKQLNNYQFPVKISQGKDWYNMKEVAI